MLRIAKARPLPHFGNSLIVRRAKIDTRCVAPRRSALGKPHQSDPQALNGRHRASALFALSGNALKRFQAAKRRDMTSVWRPRSIPGSLSHGATEARSCKRTRLKPWSMKEDIMRSVHGES